MSKRVTLRHVADYAGVSVTTVSNVIRDWPYISDETRLKVQKAIDELGYAPHPIAQGLRTGRTQVIGFIVPDLANPHFASMVHITEYVAREHGYNILIFNSDDDEAREAECVQEAVQRWVDGLIIVQSANATRTTDVLDRLNIPVISIDRVPYDFQGASCRIDNEQAARLVIDHLHALGHRRIAHLAGPQGARPAQERLKGYRSGLADYKLTYEEVVPCADGWNADSGYTAMKTLLAASSRPTAVFASNDSMALGALHALYEHGGLRVPEDMSLVGIDDIEMCRHLHPPLTTVHQPLEKMTRAGIGMLLKLINGTQDPSEIKQIKLMPELVLRESTAPPGKQ